MATKGRPTAADDPDQRFINSVATYGVENNYNVEETIDELRALSLNEGDDKDRHFIDWVIAYGDEHSHDVAEILAVLRAKNKKQLRKESDPRGESPHGSEPSNHGSAHHESSDDESPHDSPRGIDTPESLPEDENEEKTFIARQMHTVKEKYRNDPQHEHQLALVELWYRDCLEDDKLRDLWYAVGTSGIDSKQKAQWDAHKEATMRRIEQMPTDELKALDESRILQSPVECSAYEQLPKKRIRKP